MGRVRACGGWCHRCPCLPPALCPTHALNFENPGASSVGRGISIFPLVLAPVCVPCSTVVSAPIESGTCAVTAAPRLLMKHVVVLRLLVSARLLSSRVCTSPCTIQLDCASSFHARSCGPRSALPFWSILDCFVAALRVVCRYRIITNRHAKPHPAAVEFQVPCRHQLLRPAG